MVQIVQSTAEMLPALTKLSYMIFYPPGTTLVDWIDDQPIQKLNHQIATEALASLINGGGITCPTDSGWAIGIVNNDTGEVTVIGETNLVRQSK